MLAVGPWIKDKVEFIEADLQNILKQCNQIGTVITPDSPCSDLPLPLHAGFLSIHACNEATDMSIDIAVKHQARTIASMPCCYYSQPVKHRQAVRFNC